MIIRSAASRRSRFLRVVTVAGACAVACYGLTAVSAASAAKAKHGPTRVWIKPSKVGGLDCNGMSPIQRLAQAAKACTDIRGMYGEHN